MSGGLGLAGDYEWRRERDLTRFHEEAAQENRKREDRSIGYEQFQSLGIVGPPVAAGVTVNQKTANNVSPWWCGINGIGADMGGNVGWQLYRRVGPDDDRERATDQPLYRLVHEQPNPAMVAKVFYHTLMMHVLAWGNAYAEIEWDGAMRPIGLWLITPDMMTPKVETITDARGRMSSRVWYQYGGKTRLESEDVIHIAGPGFDGIQGYSIVALARQSLGLSLATERFGAAFFGNGAWPGLALQHPKQLTQGASERLRTSIQSEHGGPDRAHRVIVLEEGMQVSKPLTVAPNEAQFKETREFQIEEVARWLRVAPHKLMQMMGQRPGGNLEESNEQYVTDTLAPWGTQIGQEFSRKLITQSQRSKYYIEADYSPLLRTVSDKRMTNYKALYEMGAIDADEIARRENLPKPKPKPEPTTPAVPGATVPAGDPAPQMPVALPSSGTRADERVSRAALDVAREAVGRYSRREAAAVKRASKKGAGAFQAWAEGFYRDEAPVLRGFLLPAVRLSLACRGVDGDADEMSSRLAAAYLERSKDELLELPAKDLEAKAERLVDGWEDGRAVDLADLVLSIRPEETRTTTAPGGVAPIVNVTVNVPEQAPATTTTHVTVPVPSVTIENNVPVPSVSVTTPAVTVSAPVDVHVPPAAPAQIENHFMPAPKVDVHVDVPPPTAMKVERDRDGNITGTRPVKE